MARPAWKIRELIESNLETARKAKTVAARNRTLEYVEYLRGELKLQEAKEVASAMPEGAIPVGVDLCCECKKPLGPTEYGLCGPCDAEAY